VASRRDEFHTGRRLARIALAELGCPSVSIPVGAARLPSWPERYLGSISHTRSICIAHVGRSRDMLGLGVDLEPDLPMTAIMAETICRADEAMGTIGPTLNFVAKESFYKAYFPITRTFLEFHDVRVELDPDAGQFEAQLVSIDKPTIMGRRSFVGHSRIAGQFVAAVWIFP
jgi:4'-phosphopantetheinyl transferase EntD